MRPSLRALVTNFRTYDAPVGEKLRMAVENSFRKMRSRSNCCGHLGQPGC